MNSGFITDGYRRGRCGICDGSGKHDYNPGADSVRFQRRAREHVAEWGAMMPPEHIARRLAPALFRDPAATNTQQGTP